MRQIGGSFGIAILNTYIVYMTHFHRTDLVAAIYPGSLTYLNRLVVATAALISRGYSGTSAHAAAMRLIDLSLQRQSVTMAYNDAFMLLGLAFLVTLPTVMLLRKPGRRAIP
jgi:DHA2 family multidrug resistance protein